MNQKLARAFLSTGQTDSQVDNFGLLATPFGLALRALALTLLDIKSARK